MKQIKQDLEKNFKYHFGVINLYSLNDVINEYIKENNYYYRSIGINNYMEDQEVKDLIEIKKNKKLNEAFLTVKEININEDEVIKNFKKDIVKAVEIIKETIESKKANPIVYQSMFIEHDFFPFGYIGVYGKGNFSISKKPRRIDFDFNNELFNENCKIDYSLVWDNYLKFNKIIEELEIDDCMGNSLFYESLSQVYLFKVFLLLNKAFEELETDILKGLNFQKPFYVFGNEHDCEVSNLYVFD